MHNFTRDVDPLKLHENPATSLQSYKTIELLSQNLANFILNLGVERSIAIFIGCHSDLEFNR